MTLSQFCAVLTNSVEIIVTKDDEIVADFISTTYESIIDTYGSATITDITLNFTNMLVKNIAVTIE